MKGKERTVFGTEHFSNLFHVDRLNMYFGTNKVPIGKNNWDVEIYRNKLEKLTLIFKFSSNAL